MTVAPLTILLLTAVPVLVSLLVLRRVINALGIANCVGGTLVIIFALSGEPQIGHALDIHAGVSGLGHVIAQNALVAAMLVWFAVWARYAHDWRFWWRATSIAIAFLAISDVAWGIMHLWPGTDPIRLYYDGFQARPWPVFVMNLTFGLADLAAVGGLIAGIIKLIHDKWSDPGRNALFSLLFVWCVVGLEPPLIIAGTLLALRGRPPALLIPALQTVGAGSIVIGLASRLYYWIASYGPRFVMERLDPDQARARRILETATDALSAQFADLIHTHSTERDAGLVITMDAIVQYRATRAAKDAPPMLFSGRSLAGWVEVGRWQVARSAARASVRFVDIRVRVVRHANLEAVRAVGRECERRRMSVFDRDVAQEVARWLTADPGTPALPECPELLLMDPADEAALNLEQRARQARQRLVAAWIVYAHITGQRIPLRRGLRPRRGRWVAWITEIADVVTLVLEGDAR